MTFMIACVWWYEYPLNNISLWFGGMKGGVKLPSTSELCSAHV